jgi:flagellar biosynthesis protein FlhA
VFVILMIINMVVITKGAGRVSEVSARFTLDALPGKQMAIDADIAAGLMTAEEAAPAAAKWRPRPTSTARWTVHPSS